LTLDKEKAEYWDKQAKKCKHFNGILAGKCRAGIKYPNYFIKPQPVVFPCFGGGDCKKYEAMGK